MKKAYLATRQVRDFIASQMPEIQAEYVYLLLQKRPNKCR